MNILAPFVLAILVGVVGQTPAPAEAVVSALALQVTNIRPDLDPVNRARRAYPGIEYNIRAAVIGGSYPYAFELANAPEGMRVDRATGEIVWPMPRGTATPTLTVVDTAGARVTATWTINVAANGFRFVDATAGRPAKGVQCASQCGDGSLENPWKSLSDVHSNGRGGELVYFKTGTYDLAGMPRASVGTPWERVVFFENERPVVWMALPGHTPVIDFTAGAPSPALIRLRGNNVYIDGFETTRSRIIGFQFEPFRGLIGPTFRRLRMHDHGPGIDGSNSAFIMTVTSPQPANYMVVQDSEFSRLTGEAVTIKIYAQEKLLIENTKHSFSTIGIELKSDASAFTVRANTFRDIQRAAIGGNMHGNTHGEILFNDSRGGLALDLNQDGMAGAIQVARNTFFGRVQVRNTDSADGPFRIHSNVIISDDRPVNGRVNFLAVSDPSRISISDNVAGSSAERIVDADGRLIGAYAKYSGSRGHFRAAR